MSTIFFKSYWPIVGAEVTTIVHNFFSIGKLDRAMNLTFIALIPKRQATNNVGHFCPIALCNVVYNIITKLLSSWLKGLLGELIHPNKAAFIPIRSIFDNCINNHEVMFYLKLKKWKIGFIASGHGQSI